MPLANLSAEPDTVYFSDGLTQELIHLLTKIRGLRVLAWNSALHLHSDPRAIGREFCVHTVLTGTVRRTPDRVRISVQLVDTESGFNIWSETYDRRMQDLFDIQEEIARMNTHIDHFLGLLSAGGETGKDRGLMAEIL